jgi:hypothetical protein
MTVGVYGNPQFSIFSWGVNYGFAYNLPSNSSYFSHPPKEITQFPFYDLTEEEKPAPVADANNTIKDIFQKKRRRSIDTYPMMHRRYRRDIYRNIEAVIDT